ncbi:MAG: hypothetical protein ACRDRI_23300 [Pseudonocardiaceae bacterium]
MTIAHSSLALRKTIVLHILDLDAARRPAASALLDLDRLAAAADSPAARGGGGSADHDLH